MLSNTATPKYYAEYRARIEAGQIPICREIEMEMNRIDRLIEDPKYYYDPKPVEGWIKFCENELTLVDGDDLHMLLTFKVWGEQVYCWYYFEERKVYVPDGNGGGHYEWKSVKTRLTKKQVLIVARGAAKSLYASCHQAYYLTVVPKTTQQICTAPTMKQAEETLLPIKTAIARAKGPYFKFLTEGSLQNTTGSRANRMKLSPTKKGVENFMTNSLLEIRPMSIDKLQGARPSIANIDELLSGVVREDPVGALEQGAAKHKNYFILVTSSEGTVRNGVGDTFKMELMKILKGEYDAPHVSIFWYRLDSVSEVADPSMWVKAQPNIGITVSYETYQLDVERAEKSPSARNDILAKRFGIPTEGTSFFFTYEETIPSPVNHEYYQRECALGADLSQGDDFCAFTFLFPNPDGTFGVKSRCYITERTLYKLPLAMREKYQEFINEDSLVILPGTVLNIDEVYDELDKFILTKEYIVQAFGYDRYNADKFVERWEMGNGPYGIVKVIQGAKTETVPLGELKHMAEDEALIFDQSIMSFCMSNCITIEDTNGNRKLFKMRREQKIDAVAALMDAYVAYKENKELFSA